MKNTFNRMSGVILSTFLFLNSMAGGATEGTILRVTSRLRMTSDEPIPPKQFFVDVGIHQGLKVGDVLTVYRRISVVDSWTDEPRDSMKIALGELKIQIVGEYASVAQPLNRTEAKDLPSMDSPWFMIGDAVQLKTSLPFQP